MIHSVQIAAALREPSGLPDFWDRDTGFCGLTCGLRCLPERTTTLLVEENVRPRQYSRTVDLQNDINTKGKVYEGRVTDPKKLCIKSSKSGLSFCPLN